MSELKTREPDYGNWVSMKLLYVSGGVGVLLLGLFFVFLILVVGAVLFILAFVYFVYARYKFSPRGGDVQGQVRELVLGRLDWNGEGRTLDIGCGNAPLTIMMAKRFPNAHVAGIDYWAECGSTQRVSVKEMQRSKA
jgi:SAM-dependent methyltransferase